MEEKNENSTFKYTYSTENRDEILKIRRKYENGEEDKLTRLRRLDAQTTKNASIWAIVLGILGSLMLGGGMSLFMTELWEELSVSSYQEAMLIGIAIGVPGIALICLAYPVYTSLVKRARKKSASEILSLTDELMK